MSVSISFCIPMYNEENNIELVLQDCIAFGEQNKLSYEIVIVNDCSTDSSLSILNRYKSQFNNIILVTNDRNLGCHPSVIRAFDAASSEWLVFLPSDRQIRSEIVLLASTLLDKSDLIATNRASRRDNMFRRLVSVSYNYILRFLTGLRIRDFDSSVLIRKSMYGKIRPLLRENTASLSVEIAIQVKMRSGRIHEIEIPHYPRTSGIARGLNFRDILAVPSSLFRLRRIVQPRKFL